MFYLYTSNRTEKLVKSLARFISNNRSPSLFVKELFLVQSRGMEIMLSQSLADYFGVWCNSEYLLPLQFVSHLEKMIGTGLESRDYERDVLVWRLERLLRDMTDPVLGPIGSYLNGEQKDLKRFQLARQLANLFDQYQIMRPKMIEAWKLGRTVTSEPSEKWQKALWLALSHSSESLHRGEVIGNLINLLEQEPGIKSWLPDRIFVFGLHTMPPLFLSVLNCLGKRSDVHLFLLSPCEEYWGDIESKRMQARRKLREFKSNVPEEMQLDGVVYHPLLSSLGRQGAHFQELLLDRIENLHEVEAGFENPLEDGSETLLHQLQADILSGLEPDEKIVYTGLKNDDSIVINSCHSRMRELAVLKDYLLSRLYSDSSLKLHDIIVMAPDIQDYAMMIPALFSDIHYSIADRNARKKNRYFDIFLQIMNLFSGRYGWNELLGILEKPEVFPRFGLVEGDLEKIRFWVTSSGIRWGLSAAQKKDDGLAGIEPGTWLNGLNRMLMGVTIDCDTMVDNILPYSEIEGGDTEILGGLCQFVDCIEEAYKSFSGGKTLKEWSHELMLVSDSFFEQKDHPEFLALLQLLSRMDQEFSSYHEEEVLLAVIMSWLQGSGRIAASGGFLSGRLTFCSMLPMRSIPFRVICLLGLNDGQYPKNDVFATFDLMCKDYQLGDRSSRADDRYQFLEAIIAAREGLYLSYVGQSIKTNEKIPPSVVITELVETIGRFYSIGNVVIEHPLQPSNGSYFSTESTIFSYDEYSCLVAAALKKEPSKIIGWSGVRVEDEVRLQVNFNDLILFFRDPQSYFIEKILAVDLRFAEEIPEDSESFTLDGLQSYSANRLILESVLKQEHPDRVIDRLQTELCWPLGVPGELLFESRLIQINRFAKQVNGYEAGTAVEDISIDLELEGIRVYGTLPNCFEKGQFVYRYAKLKGKDLLQAWLYHLVAREVRDGVLPTCLMADDNTILFDSDTEVVIDLQSMVTLFLDGCKKPAKLLVEPAFEYAKQVQRNRGTGKKNPINVAAEKFEVSVGKGYAPGWELLYRNQDTENILDMDFVKICEDMMVPLWDLASGNQRKG